MSAGRPWLVAVAYTDLASDARVIRAAREALRAGARVTTVVPRSPNQVAPPGLEDADIVWLPVDQQRGQTTLGGQVAFLRALAAWRRRQSDRPSVVHVHNMPDYLYWAVRGWHRAGTRTVVDVHDIMSDLAVHRFEGLRRTAAAATLRSAEDWVWRRADHLITVHEPYRQKLVARGLAPEKVSVVLNAPDPTHFRPAFRRPPPDGEFKVVFHGSVTARSGVAHAVRAMPQVLEAVPEARLVIAGTGNGREDVHRAIAEAGVGERVQFEDRYVTLSEIRDIIADAHAGVVPNEVSSYTRYMLPVKLTEYAALGIPAVATRLPLVEDYFGSSGVHLIDGPDPAAIAEGLVALAKDPAYRERVAQGAARFAVDHGWERYGGVLRAALGLELGDRMALGAEREEGETEAGEAVQSAAGAPAAQ